MSAAADERTGDLAFLAGVRCPLPNLYLSLCAQEVDPTPDMGDVAEMEWAQVRCSVMGVVVSTACGFRHCPLPCAMPADMHYMPGLKLTAHATQVILTFLYLFTSLPSPVFFWGGHFGT